MENGTLQSHNNTQVFKTRRTRQWAVTSPVIALVFGLVWFRDHPQQAPLGVTANMFAIAFMTGLAAAALFTFMNWRCPSCNGYLGRAMNPKFCGKCGAELL